MLLWPALILQSRSPTIPTGCKKNIIPSDMNYSLFYPKHKCGSSTSARQDTEADPLSAHHATPAEVVGGMRACASACVHARVCGCMRACWRASCEFLACIVPSVPAVPACIPFCVHPCVYPCTLCMGASARANTGGSAACSATDRRGWWEGGPVRTGNVPSADRALLVWAVANCGRAGRGLPRGVHGTQGSPAAAAPATWAWLWGKHHAGW